MMHHNEGANEKHGKVELFWEGDIQGNPHERTSSEVARGMG